MIFGTCLAVPLSQFCFDSSTQHKDILGILIQKIRISFISRSVQG